VGGLLTALILAALASMLLRDWWLLLPGTLIVFALAIFAALAIEPLIQTLSRRGIPRQVTVAATALATLGAFVVVVVAIVPAAQAQFQTFGTALPDIMQQTLQQPAAVWLQSLLGTTVDLASLLQGFVDYAQSPQQLVVLWGGFVAVSNTVAAVATGAVFTYVLGIYFSLELPAIRAALARSVRRSRRRRTMSIVDEITDGVGRYVSGQVIIALCNGVVAFIVVTVVGGPAPILFAALACLVAFVPVVGTFIGYGIAALACLTVGPIQGLIAGSLLFVYMLVEAYVLVPLIMTRAMRVPSSLVILGAVAGAAIGGIAGAFFAVPVLGTLLILHRHVVVPKQQDR
jgi:predicted PurR-regulated permease PerM